MHKQHSRGTEMDIEAELDETQSQFAYEDVPQSKTVLAARTDA